VALSYDVVLGRRLDPAEAIEVVHGLIAGRFTEDGRLVVMDGLVVSVGVVDYPPEREAELERWGFEPAISVGFAFKPEPEHWDRAEDAMGVAAVGVALRLDSDAGFSFQGEKKLFLRRDGQLTLYGDWRPWREESVLAKITGPYTREPTPPAE
jgi:hypothetical protein